MASVETNEGNPDLGQGEVLLNNISAFFKPDLGEGVQMWSRTLPTATADISVGMVYDFTQPRGAFILQKVPKSPPSPDSASYTKAHLFFPTGNNSTAHEEQVYLSPLSIGQEVEHAADLVAGHTPSDWQIIHAALREFYNSPMGVEHTNHPSYINDGSFEFWALRYGLCKPDVDEVKQINQLFPDLIRFFHERDRSSQKFERLYKLLDELFLPMLEG